MIKFKKSIPSSSPNVVYDGPMLPVRNQRSLETLAYSGLDPDIPTIFLDIDGVLHRYCNETFERKELLESWLKEHSCQVVISSNWRESHDTEHLYEALGDLIWSRIVGFTPVLEFVEGQGTREREIYEFVQFYGLRSFICIDDSPELFSAPPAIPIIFTLPQYAITQDTMTALHSWYANAEK